MANLVVCRTRRSPFVAQSLDMGPNLPSPRRRSRLNWFAVFIVVGVALLVLPVAGLLALRVASDLTRRMEQVVNGGQAAPLDLPEIGVWQGKERITILLLGIDQRPGEDPESARTDAMMLLTLDPVARTAGMLSIPRDLYVPLPDRGQDRINTAHVYGGPEYAMRAVEYNFGVPVHHYVRVNFAALIALIDLVGGVEVYNDRDIFDATYPDDAYGYEPFALPAGWHVLDGRTALKYVRTRHGASDFERVRRQQQILLALREKLHTTDAATKVLPQIPQILQALSGAIQTDLNTVEIAQLVLMVKDIPDDRIARVAIDETAVQPWTTPQGGNVLIPVRERVRELRELFYNPPVAAQPEAPAPAGPMRISIQNGTLLRGLAAGTKAYLEGRGFIVESIADAPQRYPRTVIVDYRGQPDLAQRLATELGLPLTSVATVSDPDSPLDALVILGDDFQPK
ncbi:MAG: LytR family transcriptional regulator [Candidatus Roseilinea sp.]|nr:MAG: LytR family transcriptional regulator [Candidatus Roseilinea sp.]